jgi:hypothetical protein
MPNNNQQKAIDFYLAREAKKGRVIDPDKDENVRVMRCCDDWELDQTLTTDETERLVTVICKESNGLIKNGRRLLKDIAGEADRQLKTKWENGRNKEFIEKLLADLEKDEAAFAKDPIILRAKVNGEPAEGSYYVQDGNHRIIAAGIFFIRKGRLPKLAFHIGRTIDQKRFRP